MLETSKEFTKHMNTAANLLRKEARKVHIMIWSNTKLYSIEELVDVLADQLDGLKLIVKKKTEILKSAESPYLNREWSYCSRSKYGVAKLF